MNLLRETWIVLLLQYLTWVVNSSSDDYNIYADIVPNFMFSYFIFTMSSGGISIYRRLRLKEVK